MLELLRYENTIDVHGHVTVLRSQRNYMVQTEDQYIFSRFVSASLPVNKPKNRLVNVLPYESTRVILQPMRGIEGIQFVIYLSGNFNNEFIKFLCYLGAQFYGCCHAH